MHRICVFCGSSPGARPGYAEAARRLGTALARERIGLVYGGASIGLMGVVADAVLAAGGEAIGVIPGALATKEVAHFALSELRVVDSMHERKALMAELSDAFIAMPGGFGTLEELLEIVSWAQLGLHAKPIGVLNVGGYYDGFLAFVEHAIGEGFVHPAHRGLLTSATEPEELLHALRHWTPPPGVAKWLRADES